MTVRVATTYLPQPLLPLPARLRVTARFWLERHRRSLVLLLPTLVVAGAVHAVGMGSYPNWVDDPGTYLSQAWSLQYEGTLSPYSYFYDHAPAGWIQIAVWSMLTGGFDRYDSAISFGNECMLIAKVTSVGLLFVLGRRLGFGRPAATGASLLFALCPLVLVYSRWTFLDNLVTPWLLLAFVLALSPRRSVTAGIGAGLAFGMAALTKETALVLLPALAWSLWQNRDPRNWIYVSIMAAFVGSWLMAMYPVYALLKGELFPGEGHTSLLGTAGWQLSGRSGSGSILDPASQVRGMVDGWLTYDRALLAAGLVAAVVCTGPRRLRPVVAVLVLQVFMVVRGGYVPFMHVINLLPWCALLTAGAVEVVRGNPELWTGSRHRIANRLGRRLPAAPVWLRDYVAAVVVLGLLAVVAVPWATSLQQMTAARPRPALEEATSWLADNVPRTAVLVVHDSMWTDLVHKHRFDSRPIIVYKLDTDPAVRGSLTRLDYLALPDWYYNIPDAQAKYPTLMAARAHAKPVARFDNGGDVVTVWKVDRSWRPAPASTAAPSTLGP